MMPSSEVLGLLADFQKFRLTTVLDFVDAVVEVVVEVVVVVHRQ